ATSCWNCPRASSTTPCPARSSASTRRGTARWSWSGSPARYASTDRFLIVKNSRDLTQRRWDDLTTTSGHQPGPRALWSFARDARDVLEKEAMGALKAGKFEKAAFTRSPAGRQVRTNNHAARADRRARFWEELRCKWRRRKWVVRFALRAPGRWWRQARAAREQAGQAASNRREPPSPISREAG
ncbi:MAG: hypothetical protein ACRC33_25630, partial [Gemmataceae bacterium]